jgi:hypothetical protein
MDLKRKLADEQLKADITELTDCLAKICTLRGVSYQWKGNAGQAEEFGIVAQDLESAFPQFIGRDSDGFRTVNYLGVFAALVQGIKELAEINADLVMQVSDLRDAVAELQAAQKESAEITAEAVMTISDLVDDVQGLNSSENNKKAA